MITGTLTAEGTPIIELLIAGQSWTTIVDTGFDGHLELPDTLRGQLNPVYVGNTLSELAAGQVIEEQVFEVVIPFDGQEVRAHVTFVPGTDILLGTAMLGSYRLEIDFPRQTVELERVA